MGDFGTLFEKINVLPILQFYQFQVLAFLPKSVHYNFIIFCTKPSLMNRKKSRFHIFWKNLKMARFDQKWSKFGVDDFGFWHFLELSSLEFSNFSWSSVSGVKKLFVFLFWRKSKNHPFWPKLTEIRPKFGHIRLYQSCVCV